MNYIGKIISNIGLAYSEINPATLTGAIDVIIVEQADGSFKCSPFHVRFGKMGVIRSKEKIVDIEINGIPVDIHMKLGDSGEAYFLEEYDEVEAGEEVLTAAITTTSSTSPTATTEVQSPPPPSDTLNDNAETTAENSDATKDDDKTVGDTAEAVAAADADAQKQQPLNGGDSQPPIKEQEPPTSSEATHCDTTKAAAEAVQSASKAAETTSTTTVPTTTDSMSKSDSVTSVSVSMSSDRSGAGSQKRYRRKKKNRASSKPSLPSAEATKCAGEQQHQQSSNDDSPLKSGEQQNSHDHQTPSTSSSSATNHQYTDGELHPFSDSEVGHIVHHIYKKQESIDPYDCKSDSEYEIFKANTQTSAEKAGVAEHDNISWDWGELPNVSSGCAAAAAAAVAAHQKDSLANGNGAKMEVVVGGSTHTQHAENKRSTSPRSSMLGGMLGFIKGGETAVAPMSPGTGSSTAVPSNGHHPHYPQHQNHHPNNDEDKGIYLDDLDPNDMNPEVAAKYFPKFSPNPNSNSSSSHFLTQPANRSSHTSDEDVESGTGPSLSNSPHSTEYNYPTTISTHRVPSTSDFASEYSQLLNSNDLSLLSTFDLSTLSKVYHDMSMSLCGGIENLVENPGDTEHFLQSIISFDDFSENPLAILNDPNLVVRMGGRYFTWKMASAIILSLLMFQRPLPETTMDSLREQCIPKKKKPPPVSAQNSSASSWRNWSIFRSNTSESSSANVQTIDETSSTGGGGGQHSAENSTETRSLNSSNSSEGAAVLQSKQLGTPSHKLSNNLNNSLEYTSDEETMNIVLSSSSHKTSGPGTAVTSTPGTTTATNSTTNSSTESSTATSTPGHTKSKVRYRKVLRLKSDIVRSLNLKRNCNDVMFSVTTAFQGTTVCRSKIFLWRWDDKVVISDIDGTITKSDVLGHILPYIGKDWAQLGVTQLYSNIEANSYRFLYLSARAIGQAKTTREYLRDLRQDDIGLPDGPLLLSPTSLFSALHREVIEKKPEEFKIACLKDIQSLFPENPFFAGFGNKINDNWAYKAVGIDSSRIFTINHKGELRLDRLLSFKSSYTDLSQFVDQMFPPLQQSAYYDGYSSFMFWRPDIPELDDAELKDAKD